ncbi:UDP-glucose 4-epimerase GalE [Pelagicoccus albus]|uniref:UDP-glucose 4-epimerase n=1 Tax=Pelagicoccus albus TaxID=415222 RepID=A0A7X1E9F7_9BACT|nr:UDP-glucose 4-epimerase GalE [Pelagicoccus albus]MBC2607369.1 UDP-glucose 4-epimerase GalE [Pelagicoccus albus]
MKILITGTGGYVGSIAARCFLKAGHEVVGVDALFRGYEAPQALLQSEFGADRFRYFKADVADSLEKVFESEAGIEAVVHFAAYCNVGESEKDPGLYFRNNVGGVVALLEAMKKHKVLKLVFSSTCATYGDPEYVPIDEAHPMTGCTSAYGESKLMAEKAIQWYATSFGIQYLALRYFNICGASDDGLFGDSKKPSFHLMQNAVRAGLGLSEFQFNYTEVDTPDGSPIRDYINVEDLAEAHVKALDYLVSGGESGIVNLGTGEGNSVMEIVETVEKLMSVKFNKSVGERRTGDAIRAVADNRKAKALLDWTPSRSLEDSVNSLWKWYKARPQGWER